MLGPAVGIKLVGAFGLNVGCLDKPFDGLMVGWSVGLFGLIVGCPDGLIVVGDVVVGFEDVGLTVA